MKIKCTAKCENGHVFPALAFDVRGEISDYFHLLGMPPPKKTNCLLVKDCPECGKPLFVDTKSEIVKME